VEELHPVLAIPGAPCHRVADALRRAERGSGIKEKARRAAFSAVSSCRLFHFTAGRGNVARSALVFLRNDRVAVYILAIRLQAADGLLSVALSRSWGNTSTQLVC
jgi:hypothetical protein